MKLFSGKWFVYVIDFIANIIKMRISLLSFIRRFISTLLIVRKTLEVTNSFILDKLENIIFLFDIRQIFFLINLIKFCDTFENGYMIK